MDIKSLQFFSNPAWIGFFVCDILIRRRKGNTLFENLQKSINFALAMAAKDKYHFQFREALEKDGWSITHDPYILEVGETEYEIDIGAEKLIGAERNGQ